jgi:hypothetical protein
MGSDRFPCPPAYPAVRDMFGLAVGERLGGVVGRAAKISHKHTWVPRFPLDMC